MTLILPVLNNVDPNAPPATTPTRGHSTDAGLDLYAIEVVNLYPGRVTKLRTNLSLALPPESVGLILGRSSLAEIGIFPIGGVIDEGYRGEIKIVLANLSDMLYSVAPRSKVAQLVILPRRHTRVVEINELDTTERGANGFGSTGT